MRHFFTYKVELRLLIFLFLFFCVSQGNAQEPIHYSTKNGLPTNHVYDMLQDENGFMWFATNRGLVKFDGHDFKYFTHSDGLPNNDTWKLDLDKKGRLWFFSKSNQQGYVKNDSLYLFQTANNKIISPEQFFDYGDFVAIDLQRNVFQDSLFIENNRKNHARGYSHMIEIISKKRFMGFTGKTVEIIDSEQNVKQSFEIPKLEKLKSVSSLLTQHKYLISHGNDWVLCYDIEEEKFSFLDLKPYGFDKSVVRIRYKNDGFQISTKSKLLIVNKDFQVVENYDFDKKYDGLFAYKDRDNNIWVNSPKNGMYLFTTQQGQGLYRLKNKKITMLGEMQGNLVATAENGETFVYNEQLKLFEKSSELSTERGGGYAIRSYGDTDYLIKQLSIYKISSSGVEKQFYDNEGIRTSGGKDFVRFKGQDYVIHSVYVKNLTTGKKYERTGLYKGEVYNEKLILSGTKGLFELSENSIFPYETDNEILNSIPITDLVVNDDDLLVGTDGRGLFVVKDKQARQIDFTENISIYKIRIENGFIWLGTNDGLKKIRYSDDFQQLTLVDQFYENDGLLQNKINDFAFHNNQLWIANDVGVTSINPIDEVFNHPIQLYFKDVNDSLLVKPKQSRNRNIRFSTVDFSNQNRVDFSYRLLPTDTIWKAANSREITFNNLNPGAYKLQVKAKDQHFNVGQKTLPITVQPKWSEKPITIALFVLAGIGLLSLALIGVLRYQHQKKMEKVEQTRNLKRLELQALRAQMNPHFVHNSLNSILYYIQVADIKKSEEYLTRFSVLIRMFFEFSRQKLIPLSKEIELIKNYLEIEKLRFEEKINYNIEVDKDLNIEERKIPSLLLQPIVENAVNHGLFHKKSSGTIDVRFESIDDVSYKVTIDDDGVGYEKTKEIYAKSVKKYSSSSGQVLTERLKLLKEARDWNIDYQIIDKSSEGKQGTRVEIVFTRFYD